MSTALTKRQQQGAKSREEILDSAANLMAMSGYEGTSISDIAKHSGLPASSIYWHFSSKAGLLAAVMERGAQRFFADLANTPVMTSRDPRKNLETSLFVASDAMQAHPEFLRLFMLLLLSETAEGSEKEVVSRVREMGREQLRQTIELAFKPAHPRKTQRIADELVDIALSAFDGAFIAVQVNPELDHRQLMSELADMIVSTAKTRFSLTK